MTDRSFQILGSPGFVVGLSLLLTNDFVLKQQFHNGVTGKLSDFAGLFVFTLFWIAFFPRGKAVMCVAVAALFVFWKSAYSQPLIEGWNSLPFFGIQRTVDYSDLWALLTIPLSYFYSNIASGIYVSRRLVYAVVIVSVVAFTATSYSHKVPFNNQYEFQTSRQELHERITRLPKNEMDGPDLKGEAFLITFDSCYRRATITLEDRDYPSVITLNEMVFGCPTKPGPDEMREYFEKEFIDKLREEPVMKSEQILSIWATDRGDR